MNGLVKGGLVGIAGTVGAVLGAFVGQLALAAVPGGIPSEIILLTITSGGVTFGILTIKLTK